MAVGVEDQFAAVSMTPPRGDDLDVDALFEGLGDEHASEGSVVRSAGNQAAHRRC